MITTSAAPNTDHNDRANISTNSDDQFMETLDPSFVHRVLLTDPSDFASLSMSTDPSSRYTLSFEEFNHCLDEEETSSLDPSMVVKKAVRDHIIKHLSTISQPAEVLGPLRHLLLEAHQQIRSLIPNRKDLHSTLDDEKVKDIEVLKDMLPLVAKAANALAQLESESRAGTTRALILDHLQKDPLDNNEVQTPIFCLTAIMYLLFKAELCQADKESFYLVNVWAPRVQREGPAFVKDLYQKRFGAFSDVKSSPATRQWIQSLVQARRPANPQAQDEDSNENDPWARLQVQTSQEDRKNMIRSAWIEDIVFRNATTSGQQGLHLPEIFSQDSDGLQALREVSRLAVAGCALVLHACNAAGVNSHEVIVSGTEQTSIETHKKALVKAMRNRGVPQEIFEQGVADAVVKLAQEWNPMLGDKGSNESSVLDSLHSRTIAVLRGKDPVLQLLNNRVKVAVRDILVQRMNHKKNGAAPLEMRTGLAGRPSPSSMKNDQQSQTCFESKDVVEKLLCQRGLGFFAPEIALVAKNAGKIVDLAIGLYWDDLLDKIILDSCQQLATDNHELTETKSHSRTVA